VRPQLIRAVAGGSATCAAFAGRAGAADARVAAAAIPGGAGARRALRRRHRGYWSRSGSQSRGGDVLHVSVPGHRRFDVAREEDLIEEIARRHGYDAFPDELRPFRPSAVPTHPLFGWRTACARCSSGAACWRRTAAFAPESDGDVAADAAARGHGEPAAALARCRACCGGSSTTSPRRAQHPAVRDRHDVRPGRMRGLPGETTRLAVVMHRAPPPPHWSERRGPFDVWDLKALPATSPRLGSAWRRLRGNTRPMGPRTRSGPVVQLAGDA
jgi:hypothetical protein